MHTISIACNGNISIERDYSKPTHKSNTHELETITKAERDFIITHYHSRN